MADISYYSERQKLGMGKNKARALGLIPSLKDEREQGLRPTVASRTSASRASAGRPPVKPMAPFKKIGGRVSDEKFVSTIISSGLPHSDLDRAFKLGSAGRLVALTRPILSSTPLPGSEEESVQKELQKICGGVNLASNEKFRRIKPIYQKLRGVIE